MTQLTYQSTNLRNLLKQVMPCHASKNISESNWCSMGIQKQQTECADGSVQEQHVLFAVTEQPTFYLGVSMPLTTDEVQTDGTVLSLQTRDLHTALSSFGQQMVTLEMRADGEVMLRSRMTDEAAKPTKTLCLSGELDEGLVMPTLKQCACQLPDMLPLLDALRSTVQIASTVGNGPSMQGVHITLDPAYLRIESANPGIRACMQYDAPWLQAPATHSEHVLSTDAVRHLISALTTLGTTAPLSFGTQDELLMIETEGVYFEG